MMKFNSTRNTTRLLHHTAHLADHDHTLRSGMRCGVSGQGFPKTEMRRMADNHSEAA